MNPDQLVLTTRLLEEARGQLTAAHFQIENLRNYATSLEQQRVERERRMTELDERCRSLAGELETCHRALQRIRRSLWGRIFALLHPVPPAGKAPAGR